MNNITAIIQARMGSTRLAGKTLMMLKGKPLLGHLIERVKLSKHVTDIVIATTVKNRDDAIVSYAQENNLKVYRGSEEDVLDRFYQAAIEFQVENIVRVTPDCPMLDPMVMDKVISRFKNGSYDYVSNTIKPTFPDGLDTEVFSFNALKKAWTEATLLSQREHVTPYIYGNPHLFKLFNVENEAGNLSRLRWTVDEPEDFELITKIYEELYPVKPDFSMADVLNLIQRKPELLTLNQKYKRNEGFVRSLEEDKKREVIKKFHLSKSMAFQEHAKKRIPGLSQLLSKRPDMFSYGVWPGYFSRAKGVEVWDLDGNRYIDMSIGGIGANVLGYADPDVDKAVKAAIDNGTSSSLNCPEEVELADLLCELHPWSEKARFARTGGESMAIAVRIARAYTGRDKVTFCGYHGWHDWYLSANVGTENALGEHLLPGLDPAGVPKALEGTALPFRYNQLKELESIIKYNKNEIAAIVMEPLRNESPIPGFFDGIRKLADESGAILIIDEISAGFRMNTGGAHLTLGIEPDIAVFSKALGNGYPIAAIIGKSEVMEAAQKSFISSTNWTERTGPAAAIAMICKHRQFDVGSHLMKIGKMVQEGWKMLSEKHGLPIHIGGIPPLSHFTFEHEKGLVLKALFIQLMLEKGFLASTLFYSMYAHKEEHVEQYVKAADEAFRMIKASIGTGHPEKDLLGQPAASGFKRLN